jgi:hypothetical protein
MRCPTLAELPPPPPDRRGWPWTEESPPVAAHAGWPSVTVVVPSYKQAAFLEETLRSILLQGYPALELLVMDGGSTDGTVEVIRKYERWIEGWVSEVDGGQSAAINKGWRRATGELVTWLNSDDLLMPGWAAETVAPFVDDPALDLVYCDVQVIDGASRPTWVYTGHSADVDRIILYWKTPFAQQGFLMRRRLLDACGYLDESLHFTMDVEYWLRLLLARRKFLQLHRTLAAFRIHDASKTSTTPGILVTNMLDVSDRFCRAAPPELAPLAARVRRRVHWNAAQARYEGRAHGEARSYALRHLEDDGWRALPRVGAMVALTLLGEPGHRLLTLTRKLRGRDL